MQIRKYEYAGISKKAVMLTDYLVLRRVWRYQRGNQYP